MKRNFKRFAGLGLALALSLTLASCGGSNEPDPKPNPDGGGTQQPDPKPDVPASNAHGVKSYVASSFEERTKILGVLEKYAVENNLTGITLYESGNKVLYKNSVKLPTPNYIEGYGFGAITEGTITEPLGGEINPAWKKYYHTYESDTVATINMMNDKGSVVNGLHPYVTTSYYDTRLNEMKDGYEWFAASAKESDSNRPEPQNLADNGLATIYRVPVKLGKDGFKYNTLSTKYSKYKGREVVIEDYITPYKMYYTQAYGMARGPENLTGPSSIKGTSEYYNASAAGFNADKWNNVGIKAVTDKGQSYIEFTFNTPCSPFYAMYYLSSGMFSPVPEDFIKELGNGNFAEGMKVYGNKAADGRTQVDTFLSTGPFCIEKWDEQELVFKKNELYNLQGSNRYRLEGIHVNILQAIKNDPEAAFKEYQADKLHSTGIPSTKLAEWGNKPEAKQAKAGTTDKLNVNSLDQKTWNKFFGDNGSVIKGKDNAYQVEKALSNKDFLLALNSSVNREQLAAKRGAVPSVDFFGSSYLSDPENGVVYSNTKEHKEAISSLTDGANEYGFSSEKAKKLFKQSTDQMVADGIYAEGDTITIDVLYQSQASIDVIGKDIEAYWENTFNASGSKLKLEVNSTSVTDWQDIYYKHMLVGKFDIAHGGISGNPLNPLNFLNTTFSTQETNFTLNWSVDTNTVSKDIFYDNMYWSYESLYRAADTGGYFEDGKFVQPYSAALIPNSKINNTDGSITFKFYVTTKDGVKDLDVKFNSLVLCSDLQVGDKKDYQEDKVEQVELKDGVLTVTISKELIQKYTKSNVLNTRVDVIFDQNIQGLASTPIVTVALDLK